MENIEKLIILYKENFGKLEKITKKQIKQDEKLKEITNFKSELFYQLQDKKITGEEYLKEHEEQNKKQEKEKQKSDILLIEKKLLQDNENIIIDKIIIDIFKNVLLKYNKKAIGESITSKIDKEIKDYIKELYNDKYFDIYKFNEYRNYQPNQFINIFGCDYSFSNYQKKFIINLTSKYNNRNDYKQYIYIKENNFLLNEYSKMEEIEEDNEKNIERIEQTQTIEDTKEKAKAIYQGYEKKKKTLERLKKQEEQAKKEFDDLIKDNKGRHFHNLYNYFYR